MDAAKFKYIIKYLNDPKFLRVKQRYEKGIDILLDGMKNKLIYNPVFKEAYGDVARGIETSWKALQDARSKFYAPEGHRSSYGMLSADYDANNIDASLYLSMNSVKKNYREFGKAKGKFPEEFSFFQAIIEIPDLVKELKGFIVKGAPPKPRDPNAFVKPRPTREAAKVIDDLLRNSTEAIRQQYEAEFYGHYELQKNLIVEVDWANLRRNGYAELNPAARALAFKIVLPDTFALKTNWQEILKLEAKRTVNDILMQFLAKNISKLGVIVARKNLVEHRIVRQKIANMVLENEMFFRFEDGGKFTVVTSVVYAYSKYGRPFVRFPTRFTDVWISEKQRMSMPSEEKMIKEF